ncbi:MAG: cold shock domain-containing protein [Marinobacter sp.]
MPSGKVKWFNNAKGYGFIIEDGCNDDLFAHFSAIQMDGYKTLKAGQAVNFEKKPVVDGVHAINITPLLQPSHSVSSG